MEERERDLLFTVEKEDHRDFTGSERYFIIKGSFFHRNQLTKLGFRLHLFELCKAFPSKRGRVDKDGGFQNIKV